MQRIGFDRRRFKRIIFSVLFITLFVALDQLSKLFVNNYHTEHGYFKKTVINNFFYIEYAFNTGAAWSFLANKSWGQLFFKILTIVALIGFNVYLIYVIKSKYKFLLIAVIMVISGTIGNFIDRILLNGVTDFLSFYFGSYHFPIFNVADSFLTVGVIFVAIHYLFIDNNAIFKKRKNGKEDI